MEMETVGVSSNPVSFECHKGLRRQNTQMRGPDVGGSLRGEWPSKDGPAPSEEQRLFMM